MKDNQKGITIIALVITIVLLLIISGIAIGRIKGNNGILNESKQTVSNTERESAITKVMAEVYKSRSSDGTININKLNNYLSKIQKLKFNGGNITDSNKIVELPANIEVNEYRITINEDGSVE